MSDHREGDQAASLPRYPFYDGHVQERMRRASGDCACELCGKPYWRHAPADELVDWNGDTYLNRLCDGSLVKL